MLQQSDQECPVSDQQQNLRCGVQLECAEGGDEWDQGEQEFHCEGTQTYGSI